MADFATVDCGGPWDPNFAPIHGPGTYTRELGSCETYTDTAWEDPQDAYALVYAFKGDVVHVRAQVTGYLDDGLVPGRYGVLRLAYDFNFASPEHTEGAMEGTIVRFTEHHVRTPAALFGSAIVTIPGWVQVKIQGTVSASGASLQLTDAVSMHVEVQRRGGLPAYDGSFAATISAMQAADPGPWNVAE